MPENDRTDPHATPDATPATTAHARSHAAGGGTVTATLRPLVPDGLPAAGGTVPVLLRLEGHLEDGARPARTPLDLALVLDRSGSMRGAPLEAARQGAHDAIDLLEDGDRVALVTFDHEVERRAPLTELGSDRSALHAAVDDVTARGRTALHGGWTEGAQALADHLDPARRARVLLLTDGRANVGVTDPATFAQDVADLHATGIATSTLGVGPRFGEDLLAALAEAGAGRFGYAETAGDVRDAVVAEVVGADATVARDVRARTADGDPRVHLASVLGAYGVDGDATVLPDLVDGLPLDVLAEVEVAPGDPATDVDAGTLVLTWTDPTGAPAAVDLDLRVALLDDATYAAAARDDAVAAADAAHRIAARREVALDAARRGDRAAVAAEVAAMRALVADAPDVPPIRRHRAAIDRIADALERGDVGGARKRMRAEAERRRTGFERDDLLAGDAYDAKRAALEQRRAERAARATGASDVSAPAKPAPASPSDPTRRPPERTRSVPRDGGGTAEVRLVMGDLTEAAVDA
ncbi:MAG: VWA domain-containing protein, partial [Trueperaceae bacterium]|nr:VWA domain-containing protein [Trueperaceae bacterium]